MWKPVIGHTVLRCCCGLSLELLGKGNVLLPIHWGASWLTGSGRDVQVRDRGFDPRLHWICSDDVLLGKALCPHMHSLNPGVSGYLVGRWGHVRWIVPCAEKWQLGCMLPGELRWLMIEQVLWPGGNRVKLGTWRFALHTRLYTRTITITFVILYRSWTPWSCDPSFSINPTLQAFPVET